MEETDTYESNEDHPENENLSEFNSLDRKVDRHHLRGYDAQVEYGSS